jgi:phenylalanyl-tRNA synthetase alpha chain
MLNKLSESLSPNERKVLPHLDEKDLVTISKKSNLDKTSTLRSLEYLKNKKIIELDQTTTEIIQLGVNGALYKKKGLPERRLLNLLSEKRILSFNDAQQQSNLSQDEFKASLGALKKKALLEMKNGKLTLNANQSEIAKKSLDEQFIEALPIEKESLTPEQLFSFQALQQRKDLVEIEEKKKIQITITELGRKLMNSNIKAGDLIESITPSLLKSEKNWKSKKFRRYDIESPVPEISGGKRNFVNQGIDFGRKIWTEMGFQEMTGDLIQSSFWNFDALFTAQDHPVREMHDTFFINKKMSLPTDKKLVAEVKKAHEQGTDGSKGWNYMWDEEISKQAALRTHTTCLSAQTLSKLDHKDLPKKFFAIGWNFRNETVDWNHGFELLQTEGIVVDENANFRNLLGYLKQFAKKMGFEKIRFRPAYFPYTEPSVEGDVWNEEKKEWVEYLAAGMFRPEVTKPLLGKAIPVLAWGPGFGRMLMKFYDVKDLREFQENNITKLRKKKFWLK